MTEAISFEDFTPLAQSTDGDKALKNVLIFLGRFVAYPNKETKIAHALWIAHAHLIGSFESTPRLGFLSPEPASGKTRALEITDLLVPNPVQAVNVTPAYLFRKVGDEKGKPTILFDEIDTVFGPKAKENEELRGLINAGYRQGAVAERCVMSGKTVTTEEIDAYCAVALAGLGGLPDTILSRTIVIRMRRRAPTEKIEGYRRRIHRPQGEAVRDELAAWCATIADNVGKEYPEVPPEVVDRNADLWEPLLAIADAAGGDWPRLARVTAVTLVTESKESTPSLGIRLLQDLKKVFGNRATMLTTDILNSLNSDDDAPWGNLKGQPLDARGLSNKLKPYGISRTTFRTDDGTGKGYKASDFHEAWSRYLPPLPPDHSETSVTTVTKSAPVTHVTDVTHLAESCPSCDGEGCAYCEGAQP